MTLENHYIRLVRFMKLLQEYVGGRIELRQRGGEKLLFL